MRAFFFLVFFDMGDEVSGAVVGFLVHPPGQPEPLPKGTNEATIRAKGPFR